MLRGVASPIEDAQRFGLMNHLCLMSNVGHSSRRDSHVVVASNSPTEPGVIGGGGRRWMVVVVGGGN